MSDKQSSKVVCYNKLVDAFKYSNPESSHSLAQQKAKAYYDTIKDKADFHQLVDTKISEWKRVGLKRRVNNNSFFLPGVRKLCQLSLMSKHCRPSQMKPTFLM